MELKPNKRIRKNIYDLKNNYPDEFGRFIMALDAMIKSDDWERICGIHGLTFNPMDKTILCPTNPVIVSKITGIGEPQYCPHGVKHFLIWHTLYLLEFEFILNRYNQSKISSDFISLPWLDVPNIKTDDYSFMSSQYITIQFDTKTITIINPLVAGKIRKNNIEQKTVRNGYLNPINKMQQNQMLLTQTQFENTLFITNYESLSSTDIPKNRHTIANTIPLETPHNTIHTSLGGSGGSVSTITTAAHDPIFWLHHCNVDRYFYNWMLKITQNFTIKLTPAEILPETLNLWLCPFHQTSLDTLSIDDWSNHQFCWLNDTSKYIKISQVIDLSQYNYAYEQIILKQKLTFKPYYFDLINIPIPTESINIKLYIIPNKTNKLKDEYLAGMACWIGINRKKIHCDRCEKTRTNITIDISNYLLENNINKKNISNYNLVLEADGLSITNHDGSFNVYKHEEILADGKYLLIMDSDDIITNREFKFEHKYIHTRFVQGIIHKLDKLGYHVDDVGNWNEIMNIVEKFETDWNMKFEDLIKLRPNDLLIKKSIQTENSIDFLKKIFIDGTKTSNFIQIYYETEGFNSDFNNKIIKCIDEWNTHFKSISLNIEFIYNNLYIQQPHIKFNFVPIDGDYGVCGNTYYQDKTIFILIDSDEKYSTIDGLFELIVKHELGHAFGLVHSSNQNSIMYPFITDFNKKISLEDIMNVLHYFTEKGEIGDT